MLSPGTDLLILCINYQLSKISNNDAGRLPSDVRIEVYRTQRTRLALSDVPMYLSRDSE
jgi:hypothetical protein